VHTITQQVILINVIENLTIYIGLIYALFKSGTGEGEREEGK